MNTFWRDRTYLLRFWRLPLALGLMVLGLDQATKLLVLRHWPLGFQRPVISGFFSLVHCRNPGAAWSMFADYTEALAVLSAVVLVALVIWFDHLAEGFPERALALGAVFGGIAGNLIDRVAYHEVVDFLLFYWRTYQWPVFNVADSAISCGVTVFVLSSFFRRPTDESPTPRPTDTASEPSSSPPSP
jgi:signal peptidase II